MRLNGRRQSNNVEDRRGTGGGGLGFKLPGGIGKKGGLGIGAAVVIGIVMLIFGGDPSAILSNVLGGGGSPMIEQQQYTPTAEDEQLETFSRQVLASTEDVWTEVFNQMGRTYTPPTLVLFDGAVQSACGQASSAVGPFYCSADEKLYIDLSFFREMRSNLGADGDFAYAYVIAHEVGHHVQHLLGVLGQAHNQMSQMNEADANKTSVRIELQADFLAGMWGYHENRIFNSLEDGDLEEAITTASVIGDDYLQKKAQGYVVPDAFTHGRADQRMRWLKRGLQTGDISQGDTFSIPYSQL